MTNVFVVGSSPLFISMYWYVLFIISRAKCTTSSNQEFGIIL